MQVEIPAASPTAKTTGRVGEATLPIDHSIQSDRKTTIAARMAKSDAKTHS